MAAIAFDTLKFASLGNHGVNQGVTTKGSGL